MAGWPVYSEMFLQSNDVGWKTYTCPPGHRAVVKNVLIANALSAGAAVIVVVGDAPVYQATIPALSTVVLSGLVLPLYAGKQIATNTPDVAVHVSVGGF